MLGSSNPQPPQTQPDPSGVGGEDVLVQTLEEIVHDYDLVNSGIVTAPGYTHETFLNRLRQWAYAEAVAALPEKKDPLGVFDGLGDYDSAFNKTIDTVAANLKAKFGMEDKQ